jgi:hypothetical protein
MTLKEAREVARLIGFADGGCSNCVSDLIAHANRKFPKFIWSKGEDDWKHHREVYLNEYQIETDDHYVPVIVELRK